MYVTVTECADLHKQDINEDFLLFSLTKASDKIIFDYKKPSIPKCEL